jgi:hypothetical protein
MEGTMGKTLLVIALALVAGLYAASMAVEHWKSAVVAHAERAA